jgi:hypothetical protein
VSVIIWFIAYAYFENNSSEEQHIQTNFFGKTHNNRINTPLPFVPTPGYKFVGDVISESSDTKSFSLLANGGGIHIPTKLPNVLLELK